jgi:uncharacterized protein YaeQ
MSMSESKGYNGWKNYETWAVALWIDNEQPTQEQARQWASECREAGAEHDNVASGVWTPEEATRFTLAETLKAWVEEEMIPDLGASLAADLLGAALSEVDWHEVADHYLSE